MPTTSSGLAQESAAPDEAAVVAQFIAFLQSRQRPTVSHRASSADSTRPATPVASRRSSRSSTRFPTEHRVGLFAQPRTYPAFIRFANASSATDREKDVRGMSIKVRQVHGDNLTPGKRLRTSS